MALPVVVVVGLSILGIAAAMSTCSSSSKPPPTPPPTEMEQSRRAAIDACEKTISARTTAFRDHIANGRLFQAVDAIGTCAILTGNAALEAEVNTAHIQALSKVATNKRASATERLRSLAVFERLYPEAAKSLATNRAALEKEAAAEAAKSEAAQARADAARKRREGVSIGMSQQDVLASSWGRPRKVNRTTRAGGVSEQWVYDGGYLYFDDGVLTAIQN